MTPTYTDDWLTIYGGDCRTVLAELPAESVHCVVTSPPYWGLRDYGVTDQLGLEPTPEQYVENMVAVFREVRRVLRSDGTVWLNLGDSYASQKEGNTNGLGASTLGASKGPGNRAGTARHGAVVSAANAARQSTIPPGLKPKDLVGIPWRVAFALQADGWYLRSDIVWSKPNPMPESVTDRPTKSHEYVFLLAKSPRYYFDADAVREPHTREWASETVGPRYMESWQGRNDGGKRVGTEQNPAGRNIRSVWTVATQPYPGAHFAVFPEKLIEPCILAGTSERGVCPECGKPWRRVTERQNESTYARIQRETGTTYKDMKAEAEANGITPGNVGGTHAPGRRGAFYESPDNRTLSWIPSCAHDTEPVGAVVLDPFGGSGTTARVANRLSRRAVLIDLNPDYLKQQMDRNRDIPLGLGA